MQSDAVRELIEAAKQCVHAVDTIDLRTRLREALAALEAEPEVAQGWQPIETAPKDGTAFLACERSGDPARWECAVVRVHDWDNPPKSWWLNTGGRLFATHWMPLPEQPKEA